MSEANAEDAETCRLAMLAASSVKDHSAVAVWRERCLERAKAIGWREAEGFIYIGKILALLSTDINESIATLDTLRVLPGAEAFLHKAQALLNRGPTGIELGAHAPSFKGDLLVRSGKACFTGTCVPHKTCVVGHVLWC